MSDVRLTATNPEDSTVVPVACNEFGELLLAPAINEDIHGNLTVDGVATAGSFYASQSEGSVYYAEMGTDVAFRAQRTDQGDAKCKINWDGSIYIRRDMGDKNGRIYLGLRDVAIQYWESNKLKAESWYNGVVNYTRIILNDDPDNPDNWELDPERSGDGLERYNGPVTDVGAELKLLREQVKYILERIGPGPEGGSTTSDESAPS